MKARLQRRDKKDNWKMKWSFLKNLEKSVDVAENPRYDTPMNNNRCDNCEGRHNRGDCPVDPEGNERYALDLLAEDAYFDGPNDR
jgi:hypothetical protein